MALSASSPIMHGNTRCRGLRGAGLVSEARLQATLTLVLELLLVAAAVGFVAKRLRVHYNIALVLAGAAVGAARLVEPMKLDAAIVLQVFVPILLFEAAISSDLRRLRDNLVPVLTLAVAVILLAMFVGAGILNRGLGLVWPVALLLATVLASTDTIAVIATVRSVRAPQRLSTILQNASAFDDATTLVAFAAVLAYAQRGTFDLATSAVGLAWAVGAAAAVGGLLGLVAAAVMSRTEDHLMEILLTVIVTFGSAVVAGQIGASSVVAVLASGLALVSGGWQHVTPTGRIAIRSFWETAAFGVNSMVFLLIGMQVDFPRLLGAAPAVAWGLVAVFIGRAVAVYALFGLLRLLRQPMPIAWQHLFVWSNLKGSLSMALALSLPAEFPQRELLTTVVFGCALVTLTAQGLTLSRVARALGIGQAGEAERRLQHEQGRLLSARAGQAELDRLQRMGLLPSGVFQRMRAGYQGSIARSEKELRDLLFLHSAEEARHLEAVQRRLMAVEKSALKDAGNAGILSEEVVAELSAELDKRLAELGRAEGG
jgi:CPA1 family monovalent cation:H+ antiporter